MIKKEVYKSDMKTSSILLNGLVMCTIVSIMSVDASGSEIEYSLTSFSHGDSERASINHHRHGNRLS